MGGESQETREKPSDDHEGVFPSYYERRLVIDSTQFQITPNGGGGDCLFKAIAQAVSEEGDETQHMQIRFQIVDYIVHHVWEKLKDSIEIQHIYGNADLTDEWMTDPVKAYTEYMNQSGTLGSFIELTAAAELLQFNFASIQEYSKDVKTYRVENFSSQSFADRPIFHFLFTGDYESGHWEHLHVLCGNLLVDGTYSGSLYVVIDGVQTSLEDWMNEMEEKYRRSENSGKSKQSDTGSEQSDSCDESNPSNPDGDTSDGRGHEHGHGHGKDSNTASGSGSGQHRTGRNSHPNRRHHNSTDGSTTYEEQNILEDPYKSDFESKSKHNLDSDDDNEKAVDNFGTATTTTTTDNETEGSDEDENEEEGEEIVEEEEEEQEKKKLMDFNTPPWELQRKKSTSYFQIDVPNANTQEDDLLLLSGLQPNRPENKSKLLSYKSKSSTIDSDKKKGCFRSLVSYVSSMLR